MPGKHQLSLPPALLPSVCSWASVHCHSEAAGFTSAPSSHLKRSLLMPLIHYPLLSTEETFCGAWAAVGFSGLPLLKPWGGNWVTPLRGERENRARGRIHLWIPTYRTWRFYTASLFLIIKILETWCHEKGSGNGSCEKYQHLFLWFNGFPSQCVAILKADEWLTDSRYPAAAVYCDGRSVLWRGGLRSTPITIIYQRCDWS